jgi:hypothetical protein
MTIENQEVAHYVLGTGQGPNLSKKNVVFYFLLLIF